MKKATLSLLFAFVFILANAQNKQQIIANETAFAKLYGYVKYFYPGDEAASINWDSFAIYGAKKVASCADKQALKQTLNNLFGAIVPTLQLVDSNETVTFNKQSIIPPSLNGYKTVTWQHVGGRARAYNYKEDPFQSARTNRQIIYTEFDNSAPSVGVVPLDLDIAPYKNKEYILKGRAKMVSGTGTALCQAVVILHNGNRGFFNQTSINTTNWKEFEFRGKIDSTAQKLRVVALLMGSGEFWVDDLSVTVRDGDNWKTIYQTDFNQKKTGATTNYVLNDTVKVKIKNPSYNFNIIEDVKAPGEKWLSVKSKTTAAQKETIEKHDTFFKDYPKVGEYIAKNIGGGLKIVMPISLYGNETETYPAADSGKFAELKRNLNALQTVDADSLATRFGDLAIMWNVFQHFFPYFDVAKTNWSNDLGIALTDAIEDKNSYDFQKTLQKLTAKVKDGHTVVSGPGDGNYYYPAITWEWVENKLVITNVLDKSLPLVKGDIITAINSQPPEGYFKNAEQYISAATPGGLVHQAEDQSLRVPNGSTMRLSFLDRDNVPRQVTLDKNASGGEMYYGSTDSIKRIDQNIMYINIGMANINTINKALPELQKSKAIICDLRNNMGDIDNNHFIEYLLTKKDTAKHWMKIAHIIYPDQERISGYDTEGWELTPAKPHLNAKIIFLVDASDYSWAECYISIIAHYKLATIIGQPTAGTNGTMNELLLPGGYHISFSGHIVNQLDGSPHQGVGTKPDIYVAKTIKGVLEGKDEILDKAIEIAKGAIQ